MKKISLLAGTSFISMAAILIFGMTFYPSSFRFMEPVVCPSGMSFDEETARRNFSRRKSSVNCRGQAGEIVNVTGKMLLTVLIPFSAGLPFIIFWAWKKPLPKDPNRHQVAVINFKSDDG